jgi:hypothetical protein
MSRRPAGAMRADVSPALQKATSIYHEIENLEHAIVPALGRLKECARAKSSEPDEDEPEFWRGIENVAVNASNSVEELFECAERLFDACAVVEQTGGAR